MSANVIPVKGVPSLGGVPLLLLFLAVVVIFSVLLVSIKPVDAMRYGDIPLSTDALTHHNGEKWNAESITKYFDNGGCVPKEYSCIADDYRVAHCEINGKKSIGLVIGMTVQKIITGFMADTNYWKDRCSH